MSKNTLFILDGYGMIYRCYHAFSSSRPLYNSRGENIAAVLAFFRSLFSLFRQYKPEEFLVAMDSKTRSFRFDLYDQYKANREKTPQDLHAQTAIIEDILQAMDIVSLRVNGYEADDLIATICRMRTAKEQKTCIITADKDLMQLVDDCVSMLRPGKDNFVMLDTQGVMDSKGVWPNQVRDYLAMVGDSSDNIPGIKGVGEKTALKLLDTYGTLDKIYENISDVKPSSLQERLKNGESYARLSAKLVDLAYDVPIGQSILETHIPINFYQGIKSFEHYELPSLSNYCRRMVADSQEYLEQQSVEKSVLAGQSDLFAELAFRSQRKKFHYKALTSRQEIEDFMQILCEKQIFAFDCETDGLDTLTCHLVGLSFSYQENHAVYIPVMAPEPLKLKTEEVLDLVRPVLMNRDLKIIGQNLKFDMKVLHKYNIDFIPYFDTMIAGWLLDSEARVNLDFLAKSYLNHETISFTSIVGKNQNFSHVPLEQAVAYACEDADLALKLYHLFKPKLKEKSLDRLLHQLEMPLIPILARMEIAGILVNTDKLHSFSNELGTMMQATEKEIYDLVGFPFNLNSTKQLQEVLFTTLKLPTGKKNRNGFTTDATTLEYLTQFHPIPQKMLDYRQLAKLKSTYTDALIQQCASDHRIHCDFIQVGASTGRLACQNPNLQNLPVRTKEGRKIRSAFESSEGWSLISADYSQIELVILAYLAKDSHMLEIFETGRDLHQETAAFIFSVPSEEVTPEQRRTAKSVNFGVLYGMSAFRLSNELKIPRSQAENFINAYFQRYHDVQKFIQDTVTRAETEGGVHTILGRWRPIRHITSLNKNEKASAARMAINTIIQGSAADIIKQAMLNIDAALAREKLQAHLLLQVHDELILESPEHESEQCRALLYTNMEQASLNLPVPMKIQIHVEEGKNWGLFH